MKLCYVEDNWAYFTTLPLDEQWGDDWDDAPYEHNAGEPYDDNGCITKVAFDGELNSPGWNCGNSPYSVKAINAGAAPWLTSPLWHTKDITVIPAGVNLEEFITLVERAGGKVYCSV